MEQLEIGGKTYTMDAALVSIGEWYNIVNLHQQGNTEKAGEALVALTVKVLGDDANRIPLLYLPVVVPRVLDYITRTYSPNTNVLDEEVEEILRRSDEGKTG